MRLLKQISLSCISLFMAVSTYAQDKMPLYSINADLVYAAECIPMVGVERFFVKNDQVRSWHIDLDYQFHYNDQFGILFNRGDDISLGVYQGPGTKIGYTYFTKWKNRKWKNYFSPTLGIKYLWYDKTVVNTDQEASILSPQVIRLQSEQCVALIPQFYIGQKRYSRHICYDYYFGVQVPVKFRDKTIYSDENDPSRSFPYKTFQVTPAFDLVFGIKLGYIKLKALKPEKEEEETEKE